MNVFRVGLSDGRVLLQLSKVESPTTTAGGSKKDEEYAELLKKCALHASLVLFCFFFIPLPFSHLFVSSHALLAQV